MVHFDHEISDRELFDICFSRLGALEDLMQTLIEWTHAHPEMIDERL